MTKDQKIAKLREALALYADKDNWRFHEGSNEWYEEMDDYFRWDDPRIATGVTYGDFNGVIYVEKKYITDPREYAEKILEETK